MPAQRSRTLNWRTCLQQLIERNGALELAVARHYEEGDMGRHLIWRVRLLDMSESEIVVERPTTMGQAIPVSNGVELIAIISIGQNRWLFRTMCLGMVNFKFNDHKTMLAMRLLMPEAVERCQRREFYRIETVALTLPEVEMWPLLNPESVLPAERANELRFEADLAAPGDSLDAAPHTRDTIAIVDDDMHLPEVGPKFIGQLMNLGGGGVGIRIKESDAQPLNHHKLFWARVALPPELTTPICVTAKVVHTHLESSHYVYAGMAFDFTFNPAHQKFVVDQICRYIALQQRAQLQRAVEAERRIA